MANILESKLELDLVRKAKDGDQSSFGQLYDIYIKKIYDFVYYKTMHRDSAEDITSEVFMKAWKNVSQFKGDSFAAWLYTIARHAVIDYYRRHKDTNNIEDFWDLSSDSDLLTETDSSLKIESIKEAMKLLKSRDREIIIMRLWLDLSFKEIAERLDQREGAVKMAFSRSLIKIKTKIPLALFIIWPSLISITDK